MDQPRIPNFSTLSTLLDRLSIENVKLSHFQNALEYDQVNPEQASSLQKKIGIQNEIIEALKKESANLMEEIFLNGKYDYIDEERTFT